MNDKHMNCIYCHNIIVKKPHYDFIFNCEQCGITYDIVCSKINGIMFEHLRYRAYLRPKESRIDFFKNGNYVFTLHKLYWIFPNNMEQELNRISALSIFL